MTPCGFGPQNHTVGKMCSRLRNDDVVMGGISSDCSENVNGPMNLVLDAGSENPWSDKLDILPSTMSILAQKDFSDFVPIFAVDKRETG